IKRKPFDKWMLDNIVGFLERDDGNNTDKRKAEIEYQISLVTSKLKKATTLLLELDDVTELKEQVKELNIQRSN
ncbi:recombinase family protein, partial [Klebsiella pneumoniae]|nr:recombinase family protein [Klebsiella pneumoniae]MEA5592742.1 recombinase family protein [Klebsiella pneumoniae]